MLPMGWLLKFVFNHKFKKMLEAGMQQAAVRVPVAQCAVTVVGQLLRVLRRRFEAGVKQAVGDDAVR